MNPNNIQPIFILPENTQRNTGKDAQRNNIMAARLIAETVRTTLGPKGMDKMLVDTTGEIIVTNDGVTILQEMNVEHPAAKMIVEVARTQENEIGDGTTTAVVLAGELLKNAEKLLEDKIHPTVIIKGYLLAQQRAQELLNSMAEKVNLKDTGTLKKIARTAMTGKGAEAAKDGLADLAVKAVRSVADNGKIDVDSIKIEKKTGAFIEDSSFIQGVVLDKERVHSGMPSEIEKAKILLLDGQLEVKETEADAKISINNPQQMQAFLDMEEQMIAKMVDKVVQLGVNVVVCQKGVDDLAAYHLSKKDVLVIRRVKKSDMDKLAKATGAKIVSDINDADKSQIGRAGFVSEERVGDENMIFIEDCVNPKAVTILVRGGTEHVISEVERAVTDAVGDLRAAVEDGLVVGGAGGCEIELSKKLIKYSRSLSGREQIAVDAYGRSMEVIPRTLAENAGLDPIDVLADINSSAGDVRWAGINVFTGRIMDAWKAGVIEPLQIKTQAISSATDVATMILRIDDVISSAPESAPQEQAPPNLGM